MGRSSWLLRIGMLLCYFAGGLAIWIDAKFSREWISRYTIADKIMPDLSLVMAFVVAVIISAFGAIVTAPYSWQIMFSQTQKIAGISNPNERGLLVFGFCMLGGFLLTASAGTYILDLLSTFYATKNIWLAIAIVFAGDVCFLLANVLGVMSKVSGLVVTSQSKTTVDTTARRVN